MEKFKSFITEAKEEPYKIVCFYHTGDSSRDVLKDDHLGMMDTMNKAAKSSGIKIYYVDYNGVFLSNKNGKVYVNYFPIDDKTGEYIPPNSKGEKIKYAEPIEIDKENTLFLYRDLPNDRRHWIDVLKTLEVHGHFLLNPFECYEICGSKYLTDVYLRQAGLRTPKTVRITHSEDSERAFKELKSDFPIILKLSQGTQTGVGVVKIDNMRTLNTTVQMMMMLDKKLPLLAQEFVELEYDIRVMVLHDEIIAVMKRNVIKGADFRSNVSLGAEPEKMELTEIEKEVAIKASNAVGGILTGVDLIPSKDREKEPPYVLEVNSNPGLTGIEKTNPGITTMVFKYFKNRDNWTLDKSTET
jgi:ribosomal protein S6--L-glutamate ligase